LNKFEARSIDGIFFGYASHSRAYCSHQKMVQERD
jgi:hypothetical protein